MIPTPTKDAGVCRAAQEFEFVIKLTETEARVLNALFTYGDEALLKVYSTMGSAYMRAVPDYLGGLASLSDKARYAIPQQLARNAFNAKPTNP